MKLWLLYILHLVVLRNKVDAEKKKHLNGKGKSGDYGNEIRKKKRRRRRVCDVIFSCIISSFKVLHFYMHTFGYFFFAQVVMNMTIIYY